MRRVARHAAAWLLIGSLATGATEAVAMRAGASSGDDSETQLYAHASGDDADLQHLLWVISGAAGLLALALGLAVVESSPGHLLGYLVSLGQGPRAAQLYLPFAFGRGDDDIDRPPPWQAHLRELALDSAVFLTDAYVVRGQQLKLAFGTLPNYPAVAARLDAVVTEVASVSRSDGSWRLVRVRLRRPTSAEEASLRAFLTRLAGARGVPTH